MIILREVLAHVNSESEMRHVFICSDIEEFASEKQVILALARFSFVASLSSVFVVEVASDSAFVERMLFSAHAALKFNVRSAERRRIIASCRRNLFETRVQY